MKQILIIVISVLILNACSGEFYELKRSPCACNGDSLIIGMNK